uniref:serpin-ZX-like n=1 Tax=Erigeron canadensis TaxID=72917 RepID=UPI001CB8BE4C|nr:serpin-ZX-like [Erigeron canadensis]
MDIEQAIRNQTQVSLSLTTHLLTKKTSTSSNTVFSPLSIHVILSIIAAGSKGQTLDQLLSFLKTKTVDDVNTLSSQLVSLVLADGSINGGPLLSFVNGVWVEQTLPIKDTFKHALENVYKAVSNHVDFQTKAVEVASEVNVWAEKKTNGLIKEILPAGAVDSSTKLIFANAVYFKGAWSEKFDPSKTKDSDFHLLDGSKVQVPFMTSKKKQFVREYDGFKVLGLPYLQGDDKRRFTMYFYLPDAKDGLQSLVENIGSTSDFLDHHIPRQKVEVGQFLIPKFKISFGFEASEMLKELGLVLPFSGGEGLTEMVDSHVGKNLYVSSIHHKSFVEVNEEGTEAAAASAAVVMMRSLMTNDKVDFVADHPFLFVIREDMTGVVLFMGQMVDPRVG